MSVTSLPVPPDMPHGNRSRMFKVLSPIERKDHTTFWMRVGTGYANKDNSVNLYLDALPTNQKLQLRELDEEDLTPGRNKRDGSPRTPETNQRGFDASTRGFDTSRSFDGPPRNFDRALEPTPF